MSPWKATPPSDDKGYFEQLTTHTFSAGLNWRVVESKKKAFASAFANYSPSKVSMFTEGDVKRLLKDAGIIRNEKKIRATIQNAAQFLELKKEFGSFNEYLHHFEKDESGLQSDLRKRFHHVGPSTARMFLWSVGFPLTPTKEERE
jgi:DNA-3-methyladenine glycosylase I